MWPIGRASTFYRGVCVCVCGWAGGRAHLCVLCVHLCSSAVSKVVLQCSCTYVRTYVCCVCVFVCGSYVCMSVLYVYLTCVCCVCVYVCDSYVHMSVLHCVSCLATYLCKGIHMYCPLPQFLKWRWQLCDESQARHSLIWREGFSVSWEAL